MMTEQKTINQPDLDPVQRWTAKRKSAVVLSILKGETSIVEAARSNALTTGEIERWKEAFLSGAENALRSRPKDEEALKDEHIKRLERKVGQLSVDIDIMREAVRPYRPFPEKTFDES